MEEKRAFLTIRQHLKGIPYGAGNHPDGSRNHGFRRLKGHPDLVSSIPEVTGWNAIADALRYLNAWETPFFTVGCEKAINQHEGKYWARGYLEFAFNYVESVVDAASYFPVFFHFNRALHSEQPSRCSFEFELEGAHFLDGPVDGFSVTVWINTPLCPDEATAKAEWSNALAFLVRFLSAVHSRPELTPIYARNEAQPP